MYLRFPLLSFFFFWLQLLSFIYFFLFCNLCWLVRSHKKTFIQVIFSDFPAYFPLLFRDTVTIHIPMLGDLSLLLLRVKACCAEKASFWQTSFCRHCIFMSVLLSSAAVSHLIFNFHSHYAIQGLYLYNTKHPSHCRKDTQELLLSMHTHTLTHSVKDCWCLGKGEFAEIVKA